MNPGLKIKSLYIIVGVLLLINIATLGFIWYTGLQSRIGPPRIPPMQDGKNSFLANELGFTKEQAESFDSLKNEHRRGMEKILGQTKEFKDQLFECIKTGDDARAKVLSEKIADNQKATELLTYEHFKDIRKICNEQQREKFDRILKELVRGIGVQGPPGDGRQPDGPPPEGPPPERR